MAVGVGSDHGVPERGVGIGGAGEEEAGVVHVMGAAEGEETALVGGGVGEAGADH